MLINDRIDTLIITHLIYREQFARKVLPYIKPEYFEQFTDRKVFEHISEFIHSYNALPTKEALLIQLSEDPNLSQSQYAEITTCVSELEYDEKKPVDENWLLDCTQSWCQDRALYVALSNAIQIVDEEKGGRISKGSIPEMLSQALSVSFDPQVGHDYIDDAEERYNFYHAKEAKVPTDLEYFNKVTEGGWAAESLNVFMSGTGGGKTLLMCHLAAANLMQGLNVLYITLEMSRYKIAERIDANLMNVNMSDLRLLPKDMFQRRIEKVKAKTTGKLVVKQYPTVSASCDNFRHLLSELRLKKSFVPQIIYVDYLNIAVSSRMRSGKAGMYEIAKAIAEELRGLAVEYGVPIITATQVNRSGYKNSDVDLENTSESFGVPATADFMAAIITNESLESMNQLLIKQLKNRYSDMSLCRRFVVGVDRAKMRVYDLDESAQQTLTEQAEKGEAKKNIDEDTPGFDKGKFGEGMKAERNGNGKGGKKSKYSGIVI